MKNIKWLIVLSILALTGIVTYTSRSQETNVSPQWPGFDKWLRWKISTDLAIEQRAAIEYLQKSTDIFNKAFDTECVYPDSKYGNPDINEAIKMVKDAITELEKLPCPKGCARYKELCIENLKYTLKYQQLRLKYGDGTKEFEEKHRKLELSFIESGVDSARFAEYFACIKKIGLLDNIEEESKALGLK